MEPYATERPCIERAHVDVLLIEDLGQQRLPARLCDAILRSEGISSCLVDSGPMQDTAGIVDLAARLSPRLVVCSLLFANRLSEHLALLTSLRDSGLTAHLTMTGHLVSLAPRYFLNACPALDSALCGEVEAILVPLIRALRENGSLTTIPGLVTRDDPVPSRPPVVADLDTLPFPSHEDGIPVHRDGENSYGFATIEASRGCDHACTFCIPSAFYRRTGSSYRRKSTPRLIDEIEWLHRQGARLFLFDDEQFLPSKRIAQPLREAQLAGLAAELANRNLQIAFTVKCRPDEVEVPLFRLLKEMGLVRAYVGIESGSPASLARFGKRTTPAQNLDALRTLAELGILADFRALILHPWSTFKTIQEDLALMQEALPLVSTLFSFREVGVYPGTPMGAALHIPEDILPSYTLADPRVELVRRLNQLIFGPASLHARLHEALAEAWFEQLVRERFHPTPENAERDHFLQEITLQGNQSSLATWSEIQSVVAQEDPTDVATINARAADWACRENARASLLLEQLRGL